MTKPRKFKIIGTHAKNCIGMQNVERKTWTSPWSGVIKRTIFCNWNGTQACRGNHYMYHVVSCSDPNCPAEIIVHSSVLTEVENS